MTMTMITSIDAMHHASWIGWYYDIPSYRRMPTTTRLASNHLRSQRAQQSAVMQSDAIAGTATTNSACYDTPTKYLRRRAALLLFSTLLTFPTNHAFLYPTSNSWLISQPHRRSRAQANPKLYQHGPGSTNDYLSNISSKYERNDEGKVNNETSISDKASSNNPISKVQSALNNVASSVSNEIGKRTSELASGLASAAEQGGSDIQSLASTAKSNVDKVTKKGTWDVRRASWRAQNAVKKSADGIVATGSRGLTDLHFFEVVRFTPKIKAEDIVNWIDSQARSGTDIVSSKAKTLVLNFTGKKEYQFGDVTKELVHRVASQEVNMQDTLLLLKVSVDSLIQVLHSFMNDSSLNLLVSVMTFTNSSDSSRNWSYGRTTR